MDRSDASQKGYVNGLFHIFYLKETPKQEINLHYHDFRKIVILLQGSLFYDIEGRRFELEPGDMVLVNAGEVHRPILPQGEKPYYERIIIYFSDDFFLAHENAKLDTCFTLSKEGLFHVIKGKAMGEAKFRDWTQKLTDPFSENPAVRQLMQECHLIEFLLELNSVLENKKPRFQEPVTGNSMVQQVMQYLSAHLAEELDISRIAEQVHLTPSYLMHMFKEETGTTIMAYLTKKRLFQAQNLIQEGIPVMSAAEQSGFSSYSSFYRAYHKRYGASPGKVVLWGRGSGAIL